MVIAVPVSEYVPVLVTVVVDVWPPSVTRIEPPPVHVPPSYSVMASDRTSNLSSPSCTSV
jgi:hypothetical protein